jgi:hypothetical protein
MNNGDDLSSSIVLLPKSTNSASLTYTTSTTQCIHDGCNRVFDTQDELRAHLHAYSPGIAAEYAFLRRTVEEFAGIINQWESKPHSERVRKSPDVVE